MGTLNAPLGTRTARLSPYLGHLIPESRHGIETWLTQHPDTFLTFSGGKDSTVALAITREIHPQIPVVFFDSGAEFPQTTQFITDLATQWNLNLHIHHVNPPILDILEQSGHWEHGTPKQGAELDMQHACITRPLADTMTRLNSTHSIYGLRADESRGRDVALRAGRGVITRTRGITAGLRSYAPLWRWTVRDVHTYLATTNTPTNPLYQAFTAAGVPETKARVACMVDGWTLNRGHWAIAHQIAPSAARRIETRLPMLADYR